MFVYLFYCLEYLDIHPYEDADGNSWPIGSYRASVAGTPLCPNSGFRAVIWVLAGDMDYLQVDLGLPHQASLDPCAWCRCNKSDTPFNDFRENAKWKNVRRSPADHIANPVTNHLIMTIPGVNFFCFHLDSLHVLDLGVASHAIGNLLWEICVDHLPGNRAVALATLNKKIAEIYIELNVPKSKWIPALTYKHFNATASTYPNLKHMKGRRIREFVPVALKLAQEFCADDEHTQHRLEVFKSLDTLYNCIDSPGLEFSMIGRHQWELALHSLAALGSVSSGIGQNPEFVRALDPDWVGARIGENSYQNCARGDHEWRWHCGLRREFISKYRQTLTETLRCQRWSDQSDSMRTDTSDLLFRNFYTRQISVQKMIGLIRGFSVSNDSRERRVHAKMVEYLLDEADFFDTWPADELDLTAELLGQLVRFGLFPTAPQLKKALSCIVHALQHPDRLDMRRFGQHALMIFKDRLSACPGIQDFFAQNSSPGAVSQEALQHKLLVDQRQQELMRHLEQQHLSLQQRQRQYEELLASMRLMKPSDQAAQLRAKAPQLQHRQFAVHPSLQEVNGHGQGVGGASGSRAPTARSPVGKDEANGAKIDPQRGGHSYLFGNGSQDIPFHAQMPGGCNGRPAAPRSPLSGPTGAEGV
ncbi:unnamed protein product, partial [Polarella glacialis]